MSLSEPAPDEEDVGSSSERSEPRRVERRREAPEPRPGETPADPPESAPEWEPDRQPRTPWWARILPAVTYAALGALVVGAAVLLQREGAAPSLPSAPPAPTAAGLPAGSLPEVTITGSGGAAREDDPVAGATTAGVAEPTARIDDAWLAQTSAATGIPARALAAYASAHLTVEAEDPSCGIGWNTLAGIGAIESDHGRHGGSSVGADGWVTPRILGVPLNGDGVMAIHDTDGGAWDGDTVWDRAVGPMQFIPETWSYWGADGNGDGVADPNHIDDAALGAARYLCASGEMTTVEGWREAVFSYNHLEVYVDDVAAVANDYAARARSAG
jgi:hypothetical protein